MKRFIGSLFLGTLLAYAMFWGGYFAAEADRYTLSYFLYWQAWAMQQSLPCWTMAAAGTPLCEDVQVSKFVFYAGLPLGVFVYTGMFYALFAWRARRAARRNPAPDAGAVTAREPAAGGGTDTA